MQDERAQLVALLEQALIDMGDFVGGMLKYLRTHPVPRVTVAGGVAKMTKLAQGRLDLHSKKGAVDLDGLSAVAATLGANAALVADIASANTTAQAFELARAAGLQLGDAVATAARETAQAVVAGADIAVDVLVFDRKGALVGASDAVRDHPTPPR